MFRIRSWQPLSFLGSFADLPSQNTSLKANTWLVIQIWRSLRREDVDNNCHWQEMYQLYAFPTFRNESWYSLEKEFLLIPGLDRVNWIWWCIRLCGSSARTLQRHCWTTQEAPENSVSCSSMLLPTSGCALHQRVYSTHSCGALKEIFKKREIGKNVS